MLQTSKGDYLVVAKMLRENPELSEIQDLLGYTGLHWAAKHGNLDMVKLLAGTYQANVNVRNRGGYTPLHIAAQHNNQEVFDLLVKVRPALSLVILRKRLSCNIHYIYLVWCGRQYQRLRREEAPSLHHDDQGRKKDQHRSLILYSYFI